VKQQRDGCGQLQRALAMPGGAREPRGVAPPPPPPPPCTLTLYWPEGAPQDAAAPLLGWAWVTQERHGGERCTVVAAPPAAHSCRAHAPPLRVGQLRAPCEPGGRPPDEEDDAADAWVTLSATPGGAPTLLELRLRGRRARVSATVTVLYKARRRAPRAGSAPACTLRSRHATHRVSAGARARTLRRGVCGVAPGARAVLRQRVSAARVRRAAACAAAAAAAAAVPRGCNTRHSCSAARLAGVPRRTALRGACVHRRG
jgi:hypothetical protein